MKTDPTWWTADHQGAWDRVKDAMKRDWEQTKADFKDPAGTELRQSVADTVKQAVGKEVIPPPNQPNRKPQKAGEWERVERTYRYGVGARQHYAARWDERVEGRLADEWKRLDDETSWDEAKANVRRGYERGGK